MSAPFLSSSEAGNKIRAKMAILTYHRIIEERKTEGDKRHQDWNFYDLPMRRFQQQMKKAAAHVSAYEAGASIPHLELTFDDGTQDHLTVADVLAKFGLSGIFFIITGRIGEPGYLSQTDLRTLLQLGHRFGSHTVTHRRICNLTDADLRLELERSRDTLQQLAGYDIEWFAPPGGFVNERCFDVAHLCGYRFVRTMRWGYASTTQMGETPCIPVLPRFDEKHFDKIISGKSSFYGFQLKEAAKKLLGESTYLILRDRFGNAW